jgi:hypothetical protein
VVQVLPSEFQVAFKKLQKKDSTTKLKGLQELQALFGSLLDEQNRPTVLENWVRVMQLLLQSPAVTGRAGTEDFERAGGLIQSVGLGQRSTRAREHARHVPGSDRAGAHSSRCSVSSRTRTAQDRHAWHRWECR